MENLGDTLKISSSEGNFRTSQLENCRELIMFAAGTGFTPMARLIHAALTTHFTPERYNVILDVAYINAINNKLENIAIMV